jgi:DNA-binding NarL/FixJ family response regulator
LRDGNVHNQGARPQIRVLLSDGEPLFTSSTRAILEEAGIDVVGEAHDGWEAVRMAGALLPTVALLGVFQPSLNGLDAAREIGRISPRIRTALLTTYINRDYIRAAIRFAVAGYLSKTCTVQVLLNAVEVISRGGVYLCPEAARVCMEKGSEPISERLDLLSIKEREALQLIAEGRTTKDIAAILGISVKTAEARRHRIAAKLERKDTASMVRYAVRSAIVAA